MGDLLYATVAALDGLYPFTRTCYFFAVALVLAHLEIQIEGAHGWAEKLPTWRWQSPALLRLAGKPVTGYHVFLNIFILLLVHLPAVYAGFSVALEGEIISFYFLIAVCWDFLWFVCNPHYGVGRFRAGRVWWFQAWWGPFPIPYYVGVAVSCLAYVAPSLWGGRPGGWERAGQWGLMFVQFAVLTLATAAVAGAREAGRRSGGVRP